MNTMTRLRTPATCAVLLCLAAWPLTAQPPVAGPPPETDPAAKVAMAKVIYADLPVIRVFDNIRLTADQATRLQPLTTELQAKLKTIETRLTTLATTALVDMPTARAALLAGQPVPNLLALERYEAALAKAETDRADARQSALTRATELLSKTQQDLLTASDAGLVGGPPQMTPEQAFRARTQQAVWEQHVLNTTYQFLEQARGEIDAQRFRALAPQASLQTATICTGLTPDDPVVRQLANYFLDAAVRARQCNTAQWVVQGPQAAMAMARATNLALQNHPGAAATDGQRPLVPVTTREFEAALSYERATVLLQNWARSRISPLRPGPQP